MTALLPVTLPIEESAYLSFIAATLLAKVSTIRKLRTYMNIIIKMCDDVMRCGDDYEKLMTITRIV